MTLWPQSENVVFDLSKVDPGVPEGILARLEEVLADETLQAAVLNDQGFRARRSAGLAVGTVSNAER